MHTFMHTLIMRVTFDPKKAARNLKKHGVSLADAALIFDGFYLTNEDDRDRYDEQRRECRTSRQRRLGGDHHRDR